MSKLKIETARDFKTNAELDHFVKEHSGFEFDQITALLQKGTITFQDDLDDNGEEVSVTVTMEKDPEPEA